MQNLGKLCSCSCTSNYANKECRSADNMAVILPREMPMLAGVIMQPDSMSLVMEYVPHGNLFQSIQHDSKGTLQWWDRGRHVALDVAKGLAYLHSRKVSIIHS